MKDQIVVNIESGTQGKAVMLRFHCATASPTPNLRNLRPSPSYVLMPSQVQHLIEQLQLLQQATQLPPTGEAQH